MKWLLLAVVVIVGIAVWLLASRRIATPAGLSEGPRDQTAVRPESRVAPVPSQPKPFSEPESRSASDDGGVRGFVVSKAGPPVAGARVEAVEARRPWSSRIAVAPVASAITGADGGFDLAVAKRLGTTSLFVQAEGFAPAARRAVVVGTRDVVIVLEPGVRLYGRVLDTTGSAIPGAEISWRPMSSISDEPTGSCTSSGSGDYAIAGVPLGIVLDVRAMAHPARLLEVADLISDRELDIVVGDFVTVRGRVVADGTRVPLGGARIQGWRCEGAVAPRDVTVRRVAPLGSVTSQSDGSFEIGDLPIPSPGVPMVWGDSHVGLWIEHESAASLYLRLDRFVEPSQPRRGRASRPWSDQGTGRRPCRTRPPESEDLARHSRPRGAPLGHRGSALFRPLAPFPGVPGLVAAHGDDRRRGRL